MAVSSVNAGTVAGDGTGENLFNAFSKINANFLLVQFPSTQTAAGVVGGSYASGYAYNSQELTSDALTTDTNAGSINGWMFKHTCGGATLTGARQSVLVELNFTAASSASNANRNCVASVDTVNAKSSDGGTDLVSGSKGNFFGHNINARAWSGATNLSSVVGSEADVEIRSGASVRARFGYNAVSWGVGNGTYDAAFVVSTASGQTASWKFGLLIGKTFWGSSNPISSDGTVIGTDGASSTVANGIDLSSMTISGNFLKGPGGFSVTGAGKIAGDMSGFTVTADGSIVPNA